MRLRNVLLFLLTVFAGAAHAAEQVSVFGLQIGKPFAVPECPFKKVSKTLNSYEFFTTSICFQRVAGVNGSEAGKGINLSDDYVDIVWPRGSEPEIARPGSVSVAVIDGNIERMTFGTLGVVSQARDIKVLTDKFGSPTTGGEQIVQNGYGAKVQVIRAEWKIEGVSVDFDSAGSTFNSGVVRIQTAKGIAAIQAALDKLNAGKQRL
jgi:hypothetical protein